MVRVTNRTGATKVLPLTMSWQDVPFDMVIPTQPLYGRPGAVKTGRPTLGPRQITLRGAVYHHDKSRIRREFDELLPFLMAGPLQVYQSKDDERYIIAELQGAPQQWIDRRAELHWRVNLLAVDPYWYGQEVAISLSGIQTIEVAGNAPTAPVITTTDSGTGLSVTNQTNGDQITVSGAGLIEVDSVNQICLVEEEERLDLINREWLLDAFRLLPGSNRIQTSRAIELRYYPRWY